MNGQVTEAQLAEVTGKSEAVIRACDFTPTKLTELFNRASETATMLKNSQYAMIGALGAWGVSIFTMNNPQVSTVALFAAMGGLVYGMLTKSKALRNSPALEIQNTIEDRLVQLDRKAQSFDPAP